MLTSNMLFEASSNYERGFSRLDDAGKVVVKKLREWAGELAQIKGNKRKCTHILHQVEPSVNISKALSLISKPQNQKEAH